MGKKLFVVALVVASVALVLTNREVRSHVKHWLDNTKQEMKEEVSLKWEIERLNKDVKDLSDEDANLVNLIAKEDVEIKKLKGRLTELEANQKNNREVVRTRATELQQVKETKPSKSNTSAEKLLEGSVAMAKRSDEAVISQKALIESRENRVAALRQQREALYTTQQELLNKLADLEARLVKLEVEQMKSPDPQDKGRVARVKKSIDEVDTRIQVKEREREVRSELTPAEKISTQPTPKKDVVQDALNYLNDTENNANKTQK